MAIPRASLPTLPSRNFLHRNYSLWSSKKDPSLESSLTRNRRWIVNNQIKNIILRCPNNAAPVRFIQSKFKTLDLQGKALNWLKKYPCCFQIYTENNDFHCRLTKRMLALVDEEERVKDSQELVLVNKLAKLLMMSSNCRLNVVKFNELKKSLGFPDDYMLRIVAKYSDLFRVVNSGARRGSMEIELVEWRPHLAVSVIENRACEKNVMPSYTCCVPSSWVKAWERFREFNEMPYVSPYVDARQFGEESKEMEKRAVGLVHELLSLTLWKKASIVKLGHFRREFSLPERLNVLLLRHLGIFYVSNKYQNYTVVLREGYNGSELIEKDELVVVKEKYGELMQEGLHEYNRRRHALNLEKKKKKGPVLVRLGKGDRRNNCEASEQDGDHGEQLNLYNPEERKRFYKVLFDGDDVLKD
ncbi:hypothetical protein Sjap_002054 [Stephania japonica]|uniref:PORR domain-containing protein n=1 Tax=Stephania japonica TaxID=461633 RepID=A0AAP0KNG1_9MAGN